MVSRTKQGRSGNEGRLTEWKWNKPIEENEERNLLLPELPRFDFIFLARGEAYVDSNRLQELLRNIPSVELVAFIPLTALKSKEHFIF